ncbi:MAG: DUF58 domain-containing protein [Oscillospiraceae bacterium]|nr:DUF58 domain-containing protein [Oscillospiraceae bacterium]
MPVISLLHLLICFACMKTDYNIKDLHCSKFDEVELGLTIKNRGLLYIPRIVIKYDYNPEVFSGGNTYLITSIAPFSTAQCGLRLKCLLSGNFVCSLTNVDVIDFLGIFRLRKKRKASAHINSNPMVYDYEDVYMNTDGNFNVRNSLNLESDLHSMRDIRPYIPGDNFRDIHWKISAKKDELFVKTAEQIVEMYNLLVLDLYPYVIEDVSSEVLRDRIIEYAVSLSEFYLRKGVCMRILFFDGDYMCDYVVMSREDIDIFVIGLVKAAYDATQDVSIIIKEMYSQQSVAPNLVVISPEISKDLAESFELVRQRNSNIYHYDVSSPVDTTAKEEDESGTDEVA